MITVNKNQMIIKCKRNINDKYSTIKMTKGKEYQLTEESYHSSLNKEDSTELLFSDDNGDIKSYLAWVDLFECLR